MKWFKHDTDANRDPKLEKVLMRYGAEGYALYWLCLELIAAPIDKYNINFELEHDAEILAHRLKMDSAKVEEIMRFMVGLELFEMPSAGARITCLKLASRLENSIIKNPNLKEVQRLIESEKIPDSPGLSRITSDDSGKVRLDIDIDLEEEHKKKNSVSPKAQRLKFKDLPIDFENFAKANGLHESEVFRTWDTFRDYWVAQPGSKGTKLDWFATWRNWVRRVVNDRRPQSLPANDFRGNL